MSDLRSQMRQIVAQIAAQMQALRAGGITPTEFDPMLFHTDPLQIPMWFWFDPSVQRWICEFTLPYTEAHALGFARLHVSWDLYQEAAVMVACLDGAGQMTRRGGWSLGQLTWEPAPRHKVTTPRPAR